MSEGLPIVPFRNLEDEFATWDNVVSFLNSNIAGLYQEIQNIVDLFPLPQASVDTYLRKMQHKMNVEQRTLSRLPSQSLEKALNVV